MGLQFTPASSTSCRCISCCSPCCPPWCCSAPCRQSCRWCYGWLLASGASHRVQLAGRAGAGMEWFFNPFAWQLVFFTGFAFGMGGLKPPPLVKGWLFRLALLVLIASIPVNFWAFTETCRFSLPGTYGYGSCQPMAKPTSCYRFTCISWPPPMSRWCWLTASRALARMSLIVLVGQQALATFMASILLAWLGGMVLDAVGRGCSRRRLSISPGSRPHRRGSDCPPRQAGQGDIERACRQSPGSDVPVIRLTPRGAARGVMSVNPAGTTGAAWCPAHCRQSKDKPDPAMQAAGDDAEKNAPMLQPVPRRAPMPRSRPPIMAASSDRSGICQTA